MRRSYPVALVLLAGVWATHAIAQERVPLTGSFREAFASGPLTGTRNIRTVETLVGLRIESPDAALDITNVRIGLGASEARGPVCFRAISRDGRYSASATYQTGSIKGTPAIDAPSRYRDELKSYRTSEIAIAAFVAPGCDIGKSTELFVPLHGDARRENVLVAQINVSGSRVRAQLSAAGRAVGDVVSCPAIEGGPRIGFTNECRVAVGALPAGTYTLTLVETTTAGSSQTRSYPVRLIPADT